MSRRISVRAYSFASTLSPKELQPLLEKASTTVRATKTQVVAQCGTDSFILAYDFGAIAFVGVDDAARDIVMDAVKQRVGPEPHPPLEEQTVITVAPDEKPGVTFEGVTVRELDRKVAEVVALVVAQSAAMEYYEEDVDQILARLNKVSERLAQTGKLSARPRDLLKFIGSGMSVHNQVIYTLSLLDTPQLAWEDDALDRIYRDLRTQFEIADRFRALDLKLRMIQDNFQVFVDLAQERRNYVLELTVAVLVGVEVVLFVYEIFYRRL